MSIVKCQLSILSCGSLHSLFHHVYNFVLRTMHFSKILFGRVCLWTQLQAHHGLHWMCYGFKWFQKSPATIARAHAQGRVPYLDFGALSISCSWWIYSFIPCIVFYELWWKQSAFNALQCNALQCFMKIKTMQFENHCIFEIKVMQDRLKLHLLTTWSVDPVDFISVDTRQSHLYHFYIMAQLILKS